MGSSTTEERSKANSGSVMVTVKKKKRTSRCGRAAASSPSPTSSSAASSFTSGAPSCGETQKKKRARSDVGDAAIVPAVRRTSMYRGVSRHRASGKYEAHLWDGQYCRSAAPSRKGRQVYLGAYNTEEAAARAYDLAALKYWGSECGLLNFPVETYTQEMERMRRLTREEYVARVKRQSSGFTRGASKYRGVARHHTRRHSRWEARIGHPSIKKYAYLGTFATQEEAARAYDLAAIQLHGLAAVTNFDIDSYYLQLPPLCKVDPDPDLESAARPGQPPAPLLPQPKIEPRDEPVLRDDMDHAVAQVLQALGMDPADLFSMYPPRQAWWPYDDDDDVRDLPADVGFEDDIESVEFDDAPGVASQGDAAAISCAAATISSLASGWWW